MKVITAILALILLSSNAPANECPPTPNNIRAAIQDHIQKIRAAEYCRARVVETGGNITVAVYTAEGACLGSTRGEAAGTCSNDWARYMVGAIDGKIIGPIKVGGKGDITDSEIRVSDNTVELTGVTMGPNDPMCCPSVPSRKLFRFSHEGFSEIKPNRELSK